MPLPKIPSCGNHQSMDARLMKVQIFLLVFDFGGKNESVRLSEKKINLPTNKNLKLFHYFDCSPE